MEEKKNIGGRWVDEATFKQLIANAQRKPAPDRYKKGMNYRRAGKSGLFLPQISLGLWQNFGSFDQFEIMRDMIFTAFDNGVVHFDLANNYGPRGGSAEENFGKILRENFAGYRDEMCISTKAGFGMWQGPYGNYGCKKHLVASLDQSLKRMGLEYVDIFYHHRPAPDVPLEETCYTLHRFVEQGKALYIGLSNYNREQTERAVEIFRELKTPFVLNQVCYNMLNRWVEEDGLKKYAELTGFGLAVYSPLAQGLLTDKYKNGIPESSRVRKSATLKEEDISSDVLAKCAALREVAEARSQTLASLALSWLLKDDAVSTVIVGASSSAQILENLRVDPSFTEEELARIEHILQN